MEKIIVMRQNGDMREVASIILEGQERLVAEMCFDRAGHPFHPARETYHWEDAELYPALQEMYAGVDDPRLPAEVASLPVGRREDYISVFNEAMYWYYKPCDEDYDETLPLHVNAVRFAIAKAQAKIKPTEEHESAPAAAPAARVEESADALTSEPLHEDGVGFIHATEIRASDKGGYTVPLQIIREGWSLNGNFYTKEAIADIARLVAQRTPGYFNHGDHQRDPRDWNLVIETGSVEDHAVRGDAHIFEYPDGPALKERIDYVVENNALHLFGVSIDGFAKVEEGTREGRKGRIVREVVAMHSVDVVMSPAAGGRWGRTQESIANTQPAGSTTEGTKTMDTDTLRKDHPELAEALIELGRKEVREGALATTATTVTELTEDKTTLEARVAELTAKVTEFEADKAGREFAVKVNTYADAQIADKRLLTEAFLRSLVKLGASNWETIEAFVADRKTLSGEGSPKGMGAPAEAPPSAGAEISEAERKAIFEGAIR